MRYSKEHKEETRRKILTAAARLFRQHGYDGVGVDAVMNEVGLTAGGFYAHFPSKEALFAEAVTAALTEGGRNSQTLTAKSSAETGADPLQSLILGYLSRRHRDHAAEGCPLPTLTPDVARASEATREAYEVEILKFVQRVEGLLPDEPTARDTALAIITQCVGGVMLSRAVSDRELSDRILKACRDAAIRFSKE